MTVKELIIELKRYNQEATVLKRYNQEATVLKRHNQEATVRINHCNVYSDFDIEMIRTIVSDKSTYLVLDTENQESE